MIAIGIVLCFLVYVGFDAIIKDLKTIKEIIIEIKEGATDG